METITWEEKTELVKLGNQGKHAELLEFILANKDRFDHQAWDMAIQSIEIRDEIIKENISGYEQVCESFEAVLDNTSFGFHTALRAGVLRGRVNELRQPDPANYESGNDLIP